MIAGLNSRLSPAVYPSSTQLARTFEAVYLIVGSKWPSWSARDKEALGMNTVDPVSKHPTQLRHVQHPSVRSELDDVHCQVPSGVIFWRRAHERLPEGSRILRPRKLGKTIS